MQTSDQYKPNQSRGILLLGQPGSGKTTTALQIATPTAYIADCDNNLSGAHRFLTEGPKVYSFIYDIIDIKSDGEEVTPDERFRRLSDKIKLATNEPSIKTVIVDSFTKLTDYIIDDILRQQGRKAMQMQDWGVFLNVMKRIISQLRSTRKLFIATAHIKPEKDEVSGVVRYFPALPGQIQHIIGALFSDVFLCEVVEKSGTHTFQLRTMPNTFHALKNSMGLPAITSAEEVRKTIDKAQ